MTNLIKPESSVQEKIIADRILHPKYKPSSKYHDIGLLKLQDPFDLNADVRPACLEDQNRTFSDVNITASGYGKTSYGKNPFRNKYYERDNENVQSTDLQSVRSWEESFRSKIKYHSEETSILKRWVLCIGNFAIYSFVS